MIEKKTYADYIFDSLNYLFLGILALVALYPFLYVVFASLSEPNKLMAKSGILFSPAGFSLTGYRFALEYPGIMKGYANTIFYVGVGTFFNVIATACFAYALATPNYWRKIMMILVIITMFFNGGLIPTYLNIRRLGMLDTRWAILIPTLISAWNLIIMRTFFQGIPASLTESARIDGASHIGILFRIILPLSMPVVAVMVLYYGVAHWNSWFNAMIYLRDRELFPLQLYLREILIQEQLKDEADVIMDEISQGERAVNGEIIQNAMIVISTLPILMIYPILQKYFVKGVMIGALKG